MSVVPSVAGNVICVPDSASTIQAGINLAADGDSILVFPGTYVENVTDSAKAVVLMSSGGPLVTVIDGGQSGSVISLTGGSVVEGFTIRNGRAEDGGGINADPTISTSIILRDNIIEENTAGLGFDTGRGGGVYIGALVTHSQIERNTVQKNQSHYSGGGIYDYGIFNRIEKNTIRENESTNFGGAITSSVGTSIVIENLVFSNRAGSVGAGIYSGAVVRGNTIVGNLTSNPLPHGAGIYAAGLVESNVVVSNGNPNALSGFGIVGYTSVIWCNDAWNNFGGEIAFEAISDTSDNISRDPLFCDMPGGDFSLRDGSPCAPEATECGLIGRFGIGCPVVVSERITWGALKAKY